MGDAVTVNGVYSMLASVDTAFDALCLSDISAPAEQEVDHEYPYQSPQGRELKRKVSLEQKYYGTKISRREGLVIEKTDGDNVEARVVLNADKLAFYDGTGQEQLYFDPAAGCYKFRGALNVNDNFIVDKLGNVTMKGSIYMGDGVISWGKNAPNKKRYAASTGGPWHDTMQSGDIYCCDWDYVGEKWGSPYKFVGTDGRPGSDASVPGYIKQTYIDATSVASFHIKANKIEAVCPTGSQTDTETGFILTGAYDTKALRYLRIYSYGGTPPTTVFTSPQGCHASWNFAETKFYNTIDLQAQR